MAVRDFVHNEKLEIKKVKLISFISFLMGFSQAVLAYLMSSYFKQASGTENVGVFYFIAYAIILFAFLNFHKPIKKWGRSAVFYFSLLAKIIIIAVLAVISPSPLGMVFLMLYIIFGNLAWVSLDVILESFSTDRMSGRIRGLNLTILNSGFLLGPFLSVKIFENFNFQGIFIFLLIFYSFMFIISLVGLRNVSDKFNQRLTVKDIVSKVFKRKNVMRIYYISFVLEFFYSLMVIYTPIYLRNLGMSWNDIGIAFTVMLIPFVLIQYPVGLWADKKTGEKEFLIFALFLLGVSTLIVYFIESSDVVIWALILFLTRVGAALIEILRDSYFYKRIGSQDVDVIDFFRASRSIGYILSAVLSALLLLIFPVKTIFLLVSLVAFSGLLPACRLIDNKSEKELETEIASSR